MTYDDIKHNAYHTLTPAYGRGYSNKASVAKDLRNGKDFIIHARQGVTYCSVRDFLAGDILFVYYTPEANNFSLFTLKEDGKL